MKVLQLVHGLPVGGTEMMVCHLVRGLQRRGLEVSVACLDHVGDLGQQLKDEGFEVVVLDRKPGFDRALAGRLASLVRRGGHDLVHAHQYTCFFYAALGKPKFRRPLLFTEHGRFYPDRPSLKRRVFNSLFARRADQITAVSEGVKRSLEVVEHLPGQRIEVIYNGLEIERLAQVRRFAEEVRSELAVSPGARLLGTIGRLDNIKNQTFLLHAMREVVRTHPDACLLVVGDGEERPRLEAVRARLGLESAVKFLGKRSDIPRLLGAFEVFLLSSFSEGTPMTIIEAMAASVPVLSTGVGGIPEVVRDGSEGLLVAGIPPDLEQDRSVAAGEYLGRYVGAMRRLLDDRELASKLGEQAAARARKEFSLDVILDRYSKHYDRLTGSLNPERLLPAR